MTPIPKYLLILSGGGDTSISLVDQATWDYINSPGPKFVDHGAQETPPGANKPIQVTSGSWENDRALGVIGIDFDSICAAVEFMRDNNMALAGEYHGCFY